MALHYSIIFFLIFLKAITFIVSRDDDDENDDEQKDTSTYHDSDQQNNTTTSTTITKDTTPVATPPPWSFEKKGTFVFFLSYIHTAICAFFCHHPKSLIQIIHPFVHIENKYPAHSHTTSRSYINIFTC
ncbi:hypothetical protein BDA99DRAFT_354492 [Phascolomyces articulosus]|uniref:Uncharacterized protein n=1 Tax=Phascolomyces articulosus TaxID=60185 RepID=A0AAD5PFX7_9FUNG|nr:hypothetical protein BDA99DRAFT_354492 [Phascolomyces articulosus]